MSDWDRITHMTELEKRAASRFLKVDPSKIPTWLPGIIIGESPGPNSFASLPLFPHPAGSSGHRLMHISGLGLETYLGLRRRNLIQKLTVPFPIVQAHTEAVKIMETLEPGSNVILCGARVARAFTADGYWQVAEYRGSHYVAIPHPSGLNRVYNAPKAVKATEMAMHWAAGYMIKRGINGADK